MTTVTDTTSAPDGDAGVLELVDLRERRDEQLLASIHDGLYTASFPVPEEREDLESLRESLWGAGRDESPICHFIVAKTRAGAVAGFTASEYYTRSNCGLLSYSAVEPELRSKGVARALLAASIAALQADAAPHRLGAAFAEIHDPAKASPADDSMAPLDRLRLMSRLGAKRVPVPYVQPELGPGRARARSLMLVTFPLEPGELATLPAAVVRGFLEDLYEALGVREPARDGDFVRSVLGLANAGEEVELEDLTTLETPRLSPALVYGVALHFAVERAPEAEPPTVPTPDLQSFEEDILAYAYPEPAPFWTRTLEVDGHLAQLGVEFAGDLAFLSEGRLVSLRCSDGADGRVRRLLVRAARTEFRSNLSVLHLVFGPDPTAPDGSWLNEYDLIKLTKLWQPSEQMRDGVDASDSPYVGFGTQGRTLSLDELVFEIFGERVEPQSPRVGTIQIVHEICKHGLCEEVETIRERQGAAEPSDNAQALGGLIQGLLDFDEVDADELADVFKEVEVEEELARAFHKRTLLVISASDRAFAAPAIQLSLGVSPYLLVPHAVLLHNEWWLWRALDALEHARGPGVTGLRRLPGLRKSKKQEHARREVGAILSRRLVPNVFHYAEEQNLYEHGRRSRGLDKREAAIQARLAALTADIRARHARIRSAIAQTLPLLVLVFTWIDSWHKYEGEHAVVLAVMIPITLLTFAALAFIFWRDE